MQPMTNKEMIQKFRDYADCADASYAMLDFVFENKK
ncbi:diadenosine tetraphosphate hydrolase [Helicobacter didelphidarum]|uniref:Diadenosine tetraphosphate hydrolase n=1 Tax=Helicobacter didelphidarum TaxID=2040648 RepID=A0A3D8I6Z3_9HELI|nr:diadenosine tetraphosphate hydrolase [Helicobacter didelphidarum]